MTYSSDRLARIPPRLRAQHEFCFHLHDSMLSMFLELAARRYPTIKLDLEREDDLRRFQAAGDPISYFLETGNRKIAKDLSVGQAMMAVFSDFFNFIYEGLIALEKRKLVVAYAMLRKPLKENLLLLTMMLVDDEEFFSGLERSPSLSFGHPGVQDTDRKQYFAKAKTMVPFASFVNPELLHDLIYDVGFATGLAPLFDMAMHLVTGRTPIQTEPLNLNFIFKNPNDDDVYETIYHALGYILLYAMLLQIELFLKAGFDSDKMAKWFSFTGRLPRAVRRRSIATHLDRQPATRPFPDLPALRGASEGHKGGAARFVVVHKLRCRRCGHEHDFPLFWLMAKTKWQMLDDGTVDEEGRATATDGDGSY